MFVSVVVVFFTLTDRASTIPSNTRGCQSGTWSAGQKKDQRNIYQATICRQGTGSSAILKSRDSFLEIYLYAAEGRKILPFFFSLNTSGSDG